MSPAIRYAARTHVGLVRAGNEDAHLAVPTVFAVADGLGGHRAGALASRLAIESLARLAQAPTRTPREILGAVREARAAIAAEQSADKSRVGMATTLSALVLEASAHPGGPPAGMTRLYTVNIGDSRVYRLRDGRLRQLTVDHSEVQELIDRGLLDPRKAATYPRRNVVTRVLHAIPDTTPDLRAISARAGDRYLACTDGLHGVLRSVLIGEILRREPDLDRAGDALVEAALDAGGPDNITLVLAAFEPLAAPAEHRDNS